ncbi:hypothetical protein EVA_21487 [gut metagenome]|uniref:Outer membrane protein beta-barrel domain-containing protein n=1 Tax=gut metagenome TaxID=749906 RepID=J9FLA1_9ZZZZ
MCLLAAPFAAAHHNPAIVRDAVLSAEADTLRPAEADTLSTAEADSIALEIATGGKRWNVKGEEIIPSTSSAKDDHLSWVKRVNFGIKGGFTASLFRIPHFRVNGVKIGEEQNSYKIGYFGAFFMRINFRKHYLQPEISYNVNRCDINFNKPLPEGSPEGTEAQQASIHSTLHSIDFPFFYGYNLIKTGPYSLSVFAGPKLRFILPHASEVTFENFDQENIRESLQRVNVAAAFGVSVTISKIFFDFRYDIGLHNLSRHITYAVPADNGTPEAEEAGKGMHFHRHDNVLSFSLGVFF